MAAQEGGSTARADLMSDAPLSLGVEPMTGRTCEHCGMPQRGYAAIRGAEVCHTGGPFPDCYELVTVHGETLGARDNAACPEVLERVWDLLGVWNALELADAHSDNIHGRQLRAALEGTDTTSEEET